MQPAGCAVSFHDLQDLVARIDMDEPDVTADDMRVPQVDEEVDFDVLQGRPPKA